MNVSFVIPSYQQGRFIRECLDSIAAQDLPRESFEVRVYDGGSTDSTLEVLRNHPLKPWWVSGPDGGQAAAVARGFAESTGQLLAWINSDDFYYPGAIAEIINCFRQDPTLDWIYGAGNFVAEDGALLRPYPVEDWDYDRLLQTCYICQPSAIVHRRVFERFGGPNPDYNVALDLEYWLRIGQRTQLARVPTVVAASRLYASNKSMSMPVQMQTEALQAAFEHGRVFPSRRVWSLAESLLLRRRPDLRRYAGRQPSKDAGWMAFWLHKSLAAARLRVALTRRDFPWRDEHGTQEPSKLRTR